MAININRFMANVIKPEDPEACWLWTGPIKKRYPFYSSGPAHRGAYEHFIGPIPDGYEVDHLCRNALCVNPGHLEAVTPEENTRRRWAIYTHCANGHEFTTANTYIRPTGHRDCRQCIRDRARAYKERKAAS